MAAAAEPTAPWDPHWYGRLTAEQVAAVSQVVVAATAADGVAPLSEHVLLHLEHGGDTGAANLLLTDDVGGLAGYAHLDTTDAVAGPSGELVVNPAHRGKRAGSALVDALVAKVGAGPLRLWAHGHQTGAAALAAHHGFVQTRVLWQMRRSLHAPIPAPLWPDGVTVRTFAVGRDEAAWTALNARAFAHHPEQGQWTQRDLELREAEPWFDPAGFFLAERGETLIGFHWTKIHGELHHATAPGDPTTGHRHDHAHPAIGEVYVVGVDPDAGGGGLGKALTVQGLLYLRERSLAQVLLYVDDDNPRAMALYEHLGFARWDSDVTYARTLAAP